MPPAPEGSTSSQNGTRTKGLAQAFLNWVPDSGLVCGLHILQACLSRMALLPPSLQVRESEARLSVEPVVKLTWAPLKDGLRLSAELWLTFSKSELLLFIFNRCLEREQTVDVIQLVSTERPCWWVTGLPCSQKLPNIRKLYKQYFCRARTGVLMKSYALEWCLLRVSRRRVDEFRQAPTSHLGRSWLYI